MALILSGDTGVPASGMPTGSVIQTASVAVGANQTISTSTGFPGVALTGLTLTLTPLSSSSKFLITYSVHGHLASSTGPGFRIYVARNGSVNVTGGAGDYDTYFQTNPGNARQRIGSTVLDAPATSSPVTYSLGATCNNAGTVNFNENDFPATLTVQEIKG